MGKSVLDKQNFFYKCFNDKNKSSEKEVINKYKYIKLKEKINPKKSKEDFRNYVDSKQQLRVQNFYQKQHENMNYEFVTKKRKELLEFNLFKKTTFSMAEYLNKVFDDSDPDTDASQLMHAIQTAESCRKAYPGEQYDWFHITSFVHDMGKILALKDENLNLKAEPQWSVVGDIFPIGCAFDKFNVFYKFFKKNKNWNNEKFNTKYGIYKPNCGLDNVIMSWGHDEYIYNIAKKQSKLPEKALYMLRFHSFYPWHKYGAYTYLCNDKDLEMLKWVQCFNQFDLYSKSDNLPSWNEVKEYYNDKLKKYFPKSIHW